MEQTVTASRVMDGQAGGVVRPAGGSARRRSLLKRAALGTLAVLGLAAAVQFGTEYWRTGRFMVGTDDAYVQADNTLIAPRVSGYISEVAGHRQPAGQGRPDACPHRRPGFPDGAAPGDRRSGERRGADPLDRRPAGIAELDHRAGETCRSSPPRRRCASRRRISARYDALLKTGAGTMQAAQQTQSLFVQRARRPAAGPGRPGGRAPAGRRAAGRARQGGGGAGTRPRGRAAGRAQPRLHRDHRAESTARSARARCGSASTCRPARS